MRIACGIAENREKELTNEEKRHILNMQGETCIDFGMKNTCIGLLLRQEPFIFCGSFAFNRFCRGGAPQGALHGGIAENREKELTNEEKRHILDMQGETCIDFGMKNTCIGLLLRQEPFIFCGNCAFNGILPIPPARSCLQKRGQTRKRNSLNRKIF